MAIQFTDSSEKFAPDLGVYLTGQAGVKITELVGGAVNFGLQAGGISDLAGRGADISAHI